MNGMYIKKTLYSKALQAKHENGRFNASVRFFGGFRYNFSIGIQISL